MSRMTALSALQLDISGSAGCCLQVVPQLTSLRSVSIWLGPVSDVDWLDDAFLVQLAEMLTQLTELNLNVARPSCASDAGFIAAAAYLKSLRTISFVQHYAYIPANAVTGGQPLVTAASPLALAALVPSLTGVQFRGGAIQRAYLERGARLLTTRGRGEGGWRLISSATGLLEWR